MTEAKPEPLEWFVDFGAERPQKRLAVVALALFSGLIGFLILKSPIVGAVGFLTIMASSSELFTKCRFRLDQQGASSKVGFSESVILWCDARRLIEDDAGIRISPFAEPHRMDPFRGVYLRTPGNRGLVLSTIRELRQTNGFDPL